MVYLDIENPNSCRTCPLMRCGNCIPQNKSVSDCVKRNIKALACPIQVQVSQRTGHCKDCKYFEYDSKIDGLPFIVAHEICSRWGNGCKTKEDGYCFLFEPKESEEKK